MVANVIKIYGLTEGSFSSFLLPLSVQNVHLESTTDGKMQCHTILELRIL